ncbi:18143_t:CDS:1 [Cetraspora pellucida]|uniref:18143_t:CDS:1 n=1 Tax=Cetraspora pellucida TaxID=1433469 RepID=A0ACA9KJM8_9GLOM|nr:18143_t:CDS:1 [Cetraspora pellucida]
MKIVLWFQNVYYVLYIKDEKDNNDTQNITELIEDAAKLERCFAGIYVTNNCNKTFRTEVLKNGKKVKIYYTANQEDVQKIMNDCYEEEKNKDIMEFLSAKGVTELGTSSRKSGEEYGKLGFDKEGHSEREKEVQKELLDYLTEFGNSDFVKNKYGEDAFEFSLFTQKK